MHLFRWVSLVAVAVGSAVLARAGGVEFSSDLEAAKARAAREGRQLVIEFSGRTWCPPCKALLAEVLPSDEFAKFAAERVVVHLDYPRRKELTPEKLAADPGLAKRVAYVEEYKIEGFPTVVLLESDGREIGRMVGYEPGMGAKEFIAQLTASK